MYIIVMGSQPIVIDVTSLHIIVMDSQPIMLLVLLLCILLSWVLNL